MNLQNATLAELNRWLDTFSADVRTVQAIQAELSRRLSFGPKFHVHAVKCDHGQNRDDCFRCDLEAGL